MPLILRWLLTLGPTNPIAVRLVQNASRRVKHLYVRSAYLALLILVLLWALVVNTSAGSGLDYRDLAAAGASSFEGVAYLQIALICIIAPVFMAGAIAAEADPKTWDIILSTPLTQTQIVLGNLLGRLFFVLALLFASLPLFALTQYFGGVPGSSIFASYLIAGCAATLVGTIAVALAVSRLAGRRAVFAFYISVVTYIAATFAIDFYLSNRAGLGAGPRGDGVTWLTALNPFLALRALLDPSEYPRAMPGSRAGVAAFMLERPVTAWCVISSTLSVVLMVVSTLTVRLGGLAAIGQDRSGVPIYRRMFGLGAKDADHRPPRPVGANPISWREATARNATFARILGRWSFIALGLLFGLGIVVAYDAFPSITPASFQFTLRATVWTEVAVITLIAINMAATAISREREDGTLDLILTTPVTPKMYLAGKLRGLVAYLLPMIAVPVGTLLFAGFYSLVGGVMRSGGGRLTYVWNRNAVGPDLLAEGATRPTNVPTLDVPIVLPEAPIIAAIVLVPFIAFCVMVGLQWSLKSKGTLSSVIATVAIVSIVAGTVGICAWASATSIEFIGPFLGPLSPASALGGVVSPIEMFAGTMQDQPNALPMIRLWTVIGALLSAGIHVAIVYGIRASMVRNFDFTVRKLSGTK